MKQFSLALLCLFASLAYAQCPGGTCNAATCSVTDVQAAVNTAINGDTVVIPSCPSATGTPGVANDWNATLSVTNSINLVGSGAGVTVLIDDVNKSSCSGNHSLINISNTAQGTAAWSLGQFSVQGHSVDTNICLNHINVVTYSHAFRIHDIAWNNLQSRALHLDGDEWGVVDHSTFQGNFKGGIQVWHSQYKQVGDKGDNSWAAPDAMGAVGTLANPSDAGAGVFVEDNVFNVTNSQSSSNVECDSHGARVDVRHNTMNELGSHGTDTTHRSRSCRTVLVHDNVFNDSGSAITQALQLRGGTSLFYNNTLNPSIGGNYAKLLVLEDYREPDGFTPWGPSGTVKGACDGTGAFDTNIGGVSTSGTHNGSSGILDVLTDTTATWTLNQWAGYSLRNTGATSWGASVKSNTACPGTCTITTYAGVFSPTHNWNAGDSYEIRQAYPCLDQPGRGQGDLLAGGSDTVAPTPSGWPHEALDPAYGWGNFRSGVEVATINGVYSHVVANRDYYDWNASFNGTTGTGEGLLAARPATCTPFVGYWATNTNTLYQCTSTNTWSVYYQPYTYPHPLVTPVPPPPAPAPAAIFSQKSTSTVERGTK